MRLRVTSILLLGLLAGVAAGAQGTSVFNRLEGATVVSLQDAMTSGELSSSRITRVYMSRIQRFDEEFNSVITINPNAFDDAKKLDRERRSGQVRGPLHGIPVLLKDNIETKDLMSTTAGSLALTGNVTDRDAFLVARLRDAGVVILGKTNLSEWANFRSERSSSGWSAVGGQTHNPYDVTRNPCGSSSGSAVAVAAAFAPIAVGTETNGSIVCPANANGVVGIKPTLGLVSRTGIVPIAHSQDTAGPIATTVADAVALLEFMIGRDNADPSTELADQTAAWELSEHLKVDGLSGKRIGVLRSAAGFHDGVDRLFEEAIVDMRNAGAEIVDGLELKAPKGLGRAAYDVLLYEFKHDLNAYLAALPEQTLSPAGSLEELIEFNRAHADLEMPHFGQEIFLEAQAKGPLTDTAYLKALALVRKASRKDGIDHLVAKHKLDLIIAPTGSPAWKTDHVNGDHFLGASSSLPARAGYPNITVPMGFVSELPVGISFFGPQLSEPILIEAAYAFEVATGHRKPPEI